MKFRIFRFFMIFDIFFSWNFTNFEYLTCITQKFDDGTIWSPPKASIQQIKLIFSKFFFALWGLKFFLDFFHFFTIFFFLNFSLIFMSLDRNFVKILFKKLHKLSIKFSIFPIIFSNIFWQFPTLNLMSSFSCFLINYRIICLIKFNSHS